MIDESDMIADLKAVGTPEAALFAAIMLQALADAKTLGSRRSTRAHTQIYRESFIDRDARQLMRECAHPWMQSVCDLIDVDHWKFVRLIRSRLQPILGDS